MSAKSDYRYCRRLPADFPAVSPLLTVSVAHLSHPLIGADGVIVHPQLSNWNTHCALGNIVRTISTDFLANPPVYNPPQPRPDKAQAAAAAAAASPTSQQPNPIALPPIPQVCEELRRLPTDRLVAMDQSTIEVEEFAEGLPIYEAIVQLRADIEKNVVEVARANLAVADDISDLQRDVDELSGKVQAAKTAYDAARLRQETLLAQYSAPAMALLFEKKADRVDMASEDVRQKYISGDLNEDAFVAQFMAGRVAFHRLMVTRERLLHA